VTSYRVGQVLYVVLSKEARIYPMQVVEEVTKKTLEGSVTTYMVRGGPNTEETLAIEQIEGEIFDSAGKVQKALIERATAGITSRVEAAVSKSQEWYPTGFEQAADDELASLKKVPVKQVGDGTPGIPTQQGRPRPPQLGKKPKGPPPEVAALAAELAAETKQLEVELPDGTRAKVGSIKVPDVLQG